MKILVVGSGGREHAIAKKFLESDKVTDVFVAPGNDGMKVDNIQLLAIGENDFDALIQFAKEQQVQFTFVGPEVPLVNGIVDSFEKEGLKIFGPSKVAAQIEGSKDFAKQIMKKYDIPTAQYETFSDLEKAKAYVNEKGAPIVLKADGLAAGKGVVVALTLEEAILALEDMLSGNKFGESGAKVVVEDFLEGEEFSLLSFVKNDLVYPMIIAQDHKRAFDGDRGPNTGGMGAYAPVAHIPQDVVTHAVEHIVKPTAKAMIEEGSAFTGILYAGLILTKEGPKVIEYNARFGDPETQVVLPRLTSDFAQIIDDILNDKVPTITWQEGGVTLGVVVATDGYPGDYPKGLDLSGIKKVEHSNIYYAGAKEENGHLVSNGGRVLLLEKTADSVKEAQKWIYEDLENANLSGFFYRSDIGDKAVK